MTKKKSEVVEKRKGGRPTITESPMEQKHITVPTETLIWLYYFGGNNFSQGIRDAASLLAALPPSELRELRRKHAI